MDNTLPADDQVGARETLQARQVITEAEFRVVDVSLVVLTALALFYTLYFAAAIILPLILALVLSLLLDPAVSVLHRRVRLPRMLAAAVTILLLFSVIIGIGYAVSVPAAGWIARAPEGIHVLEQKLGFLRRPINMVQTVAGEAERVLQREPGPAVPQVTLSQGSGVGLSVLLGTRIILGQMLTFVVMLFFLLAEGDTLLRRFVEILPGLAEKKRAVQIITQIEKNISQYLITITAMNMLVGVANGLSIWALGLPDPLLWGTVAFLLNYIPILGPLFGMVLFFFVGLFSYSNVAWALAPSGIYLVVHVLEGETITPMLLAQRFTLNPVLVIATLMFWDWMWGIPGALLAVPLLAATKIVCDQIEVLTPLGHLLGAATPAGPRKEARPGGSAPWTPA
jgi:predicted PurR-regulated permease PerM